MGRIGWAIVLVALVATSSVLVTPPASAGDTATKTEPDTSVGSDEATPAPPEVEDGSAFSDDPACRTNQLARNDDGSTGRVALPFTADFYGTTYDSLYVNNNGNVTFDQSLSTYTPEPLVELSRVIIAPFWADVDTRNPQSNLVTYGTTMVNGRNAFCVSWADVGYYDSHVDKLNTFQLFLVERADRRVGDFDIVMNFDQIQWETGDASGGSGGIGGSPARVGFSDGDTATTEISGSGVSGAFLDGSATALVGRRHQSDLAGQLVFDVRNGAPPGHAYVALGDSYSSGEGAPHPTTGFGSTDAPNNRCHRSESAYPSLVAQTLDDTRFVFGACSGALIDDLYRPNPDNAGEVPQLDRLDVPFDLDLVTATIGGNDAGFAPIIALCTLRVGCNLDLILVASVSFWVASLHDDLVAAYGDIAQDAGDARVIVLTYPQMMPTSFLGCARTAGLSQGERQWMRGVTTQLNDVIRSAGAEAGVEVLSLDDAFAGHDICSGAPYVNGWVPRLAWNPFRDVEYSFHPNPSGHARMASSVTGVVGAAAEEPTEAPLPPEPIDADASPISFATLDLLTNMVDGVVVNRDAETIIAADGFAPGSTVTAETVLMDEADPDAEPAPVPVAQVTADGDGRAIVTLPPADDGPAGLYHLALTGQNAQGGPHVAATSAYLPEEGCRRLAEFPDVPADHPFCIPIDWLADREITTGFSDGRYRPASDVTRQSMSAFLYRLAGRPELDPPGSPSFPDVPLHHPFFEEIEWMVAEGITTGFADGRFHPAANVSRQAMSAFMYRLAGEPAYTPPGVATFADVPTDHPFFAEIEWMANVRVTNGYADGRYRPSAPVSRAAMAAFMFRLYGVLSSLAAT